MNQSKKTLTLKKIPDTKRPGNLEHYKKIKPKNNRNRGIEEGEEH